MKTIKTILAIFTFICIATSIQAQSVEDIFESYWKGGSKTKSNLTDDDYIISQIVMYNVDYNSSYDTFTATLATTYVFDDDSYSCRTEVKGKVHLNSGRVDIKHIRTIDYDHLPYELIWTHTDIYLTIYNDTDCDGYFGMVGKSTDQSGEDEYILLSNCPNY